MLEELNQLLPGIKLIEASSFKLLGAPVLAEGLNGSLSSGLDSVKTMCARLPSLDIHPALRILRCSLSSPRFVYVLRTSPAFLLENLLTEIDMFYRKTLETVTNNKISNTSWRQATLLMAFSGLGIRSTIDLAHPAYFSSVFQSEALSDLILAKSNLHIVDTHFSSLIAAYPIEWTPPTIELKRSQSAGTPCGVKQFSTIYYQ